MEFTGELETHLTVYLKESKNIAELQKWGEAHGLKCLHIVLEQGITVSQPMLTRRVSGNLPDELVAAGHFSELLTAAGFPVVRIKIEAAPWTEDVPQTAEDVVAGILPETRYFESHIRILYNPQVNNTALPAIVEKHSAHLSRNALRRNRHDGFEERFVTQRGRLAGYSEFRAKLNILLQEIRRLGYTVVDVEEEYVVYDNNLNIDAGWITAEE